MPAKPLRYRVGDPAPCSHMRELQACGRAGFRNRRRHEGGLGEAVRPTMDAEHGAARYQRSPPEPAAAGAP